MDEYLTLKEASAKYKASKTAIYKRIQTGQLTYSKPFGKVLIKLSELERLFKRCQVL